MGEHKTHCPDCDATHLLDHREYCEIGHVRLRNEVDRLRVELPRPTEVLPNGCSFCGAPEDAAGMMVGGVSGARICAACVVQATSHMVGCANTMMVRARAEQAQGRQEGKRDERDGTEQAQGAR